MTWNKYHSISLTISLFLMPIYFYLMYWIIKHSEPDRLIWFLFWSYIPIKVILSILTKVAESEK